jgi:hypothetical protein
MIEPTKVARDMLVAEIDRLSPGDQEKLYRVVMAIKEEFIEPGEERYYAESWQRAEREATEAHQRGGLPGFDTVDELMSYIEAGIEPE